jgi:hypothetical protein
MAILLIFLPLVIWDLAHQWWLTAGLGALFMLPISVVFYVLFYRKPTVAFVPIVFLVSVSNKQNGYLHTRAGETFSLGLFKFIH